MLNRASLFIFSIFAMLFSAFARADAVDYTTLTAAVDFSGVITAIMTVFAALAGVYIVMKGGSMILSKLRGG